MCLRRALVLVLFGLALVVPNAAAMADIVYQNTSTPVRTLNPDPNYWYCPNGFWPFNQFAPNEAMGNQIKLAGTDRSVQEFDLIIDSTRPTVLGSITLTFYDNDGIDVGGAPGAPGTTIWSTTKSNVAVDGYTTVAFAVPSVNVPDVFTWTAGADSDIAGMATMTPPTIGSSDDLYWDFASDEQVWYPMYFGGDPVATFGAEVIAVPEPMTIMLIGTFAVPALCRRRRPAPA